MNKDLEKAVWWMLKEIESKLSKTDNHILFLYRPQTEDTPTRDDQRRALEWLSKEGVIKDAVTYYDGIFSALKSINNDPPDGLYLVIDNTRYKQTSFDFIKKFDFAKKTPISLPPQTRWEEITIKFINGCDVHIFLGKKLIIKSDYKEMGFEDKKRKTFNRQWELLNLLAQTNGEICAGDKKTLDNGKKRKQYLADQLRLCFGIESDPFYSYRKEKGYKIKINLIPEKQNTNKQNDDIDESDDISSFYKEMTPGIYQAE